MESLDERVARGLRQLRGQGFTPAGNRGGVREFEGTLPCSGGPVRVRLSIGDWDFTDYPEIRVLKGFDNLPALLPHLSEHGWLCYFATGAAVLDRYEPEQAIAQCLEQARAVLDRVRTDPEYRRTDVQDEFMVHWLRGQSTGIWPVLIGPLSATAKRSSYWIVGVHGTKRAVIADSADEVAALACAFGGSTPKQTSCPCWIFHTKALPLVPEKMPSTVKELFDWLKLWDAKVYNAMQRVLDKEPSYLEHSFASFAVNTPIGWLGFGFDLDPVKRLGAKRRPGLYRQHLHGRGSTRGLLRLVIDDVSPSFVHSRNLTFKDLGGRRIVVVGCGAVGSYVAQALCRLGAGSGGGELLLVDPDTLKPENLGRHVLGYPDLFKLKAEGLRNELARQFPLSKITFRAQDAMRLPGLFGFSLVVEATGEESVSEAMNAKRLERDTDTPMLHTWIKGNGQAVQALWVQRKHGGCFRCLRLADKKRNREERFKLLKGDVERRFLGCSSFTPYAVAAPMHAATLCTEIVMDWLQRDRPDPTFRTRSTANADVYRVKDQNLTRLEGCPACETSHASIKSAD